MTQYGLDGVSLTIEGILNDLVGADLHPVIGVELLRVLGVRPFRQILQVFVRQRQDEDRKSVV